MPEPLSDADLILHPDGRVYHLGLLPSQVPDLVLTVGDPDRVPLVSQHFDGIEEKAAHREFVSHIGRVGQKKLMVISTGMGTDNVEILMNELDALVNLNWSTRVPREPTRSLTIIRLGTSGAISLPVALDSVLASREAIGLDTLMQFYPYRTPEPYREVVQVTKELLQLEFTPYAATADDQLLAAFSQFSTGITLTCPGFYAPQGRKTRITPSQDNFLSRLSGLRCGSESLTNLEMETAGYYALGNLFSHRMLSLNAILANRITGKFSSNPDRTVNRMIEKALAVVDSL